VLVWCTAIWWGRTACSRHWWCCTACTYAVLLYCLHHCMGMSLYCLYCKRMLPVPLTVLPYCRTRVVLPMCTAEDGNGGYVITEQFVKDMLTEFKDQRLIHKRFAFQILLQVRSANSTGCAVLCCAVDTCWSPGCAHYHRAMGPSAVGQLIPACSPSCYVCSSTTTHTAMLNTAWNSAACTVSHSIP
jgi:hypothetical protein